MNPDLQFSVDHCLDVLANGATHIRQELTQLREDRNKLLTVLPEFHRLRQENAELRAAGASYIVEGPHTNFPVPKHTLSTIPRDIVHLIFKETVPATYQYDTSPLIKNIRMVACPVGGDFAWRAKEELGFILRECHALRSLSYIPHRNFPHLSDESQDSSGGSYFNLMWFFHVSTSHMQPPFLDGLVASRLHRLSLQFVLTDSRLKNLHDLLLGTTSPQSLVLDYPTHALVLSQAPEGVSAVRLPSLVELRIPFGQDAIFDEYICSKWELPTLTRATLVSLQRWPERLLERFGGRLVYLHIFTKNHYDTYTCNDDPCITLASHCPMLEHLVIPNPHCCSQKFPATTMHSLTLKHLDMWDFGAYEHFLTRARYYLWQQPVTSRSGGWLENVRSNGSVPALQTVRLLFTQYGNYRGMDWPSICHPDILLDCPDDEIWHAFPNAYVAQTATRLIPYSPHPIILIPDDESMPESDSDDDWTPSSSSHNDSDDEDSEASGRTDESEDMMEGCAIQGDYV